VTAQPALRLLRGHTTHQRSVPFTHRFRYGLSLIDVDVDRLSDAATQSALFSVDKVNLFSFNASDHLDDETTTLRGWADKHFKAAGVDISSASLRLITFPRHLFYKFAPLSLWLSFDTNQNLIGILYEVHNTFGERHVYAAATPDAPNVRHVSDKVFHVSPFFDISGKYQFSLKQDATQFRLVVASIENGQQTHMATIMTRPQAASSGAFAKLAITKPLSSWAVTLAIHWQALKLWIKGARYHSRPSMPSNWVSTAQTVSRSSVEETAP